jgi:hypothetical protein
MLKAMASFDLTQPVKLQWQHGMLVAAPLIAFTMPSTQEIFARYRPGILPDWCEKLRRPFVQWRFRYAWLVAVAALAGVACFYETDFPQFLYWNF